MRLVELRTFTGDPSAEGEPVFVAPDNVGMVAVAMADPPAAEVWLKVGTPMLLVDGSARAVSELLAEGKVDRLPAPPKPIAEPRRPRADGMTWRT
ncbi:MULTISPECIES: hypothetical protein [unclassified Methylobacterium]|jgi:hypothetical protein|uniref:hypothetical protein n=1 Tax=unclassified Methylobacterium TaxID=2615210 RepID=UPI0005BDDCE3|nr:MULTISPECIES: hypothetical protein [unclassified Methylobacterium]SFV11695.1 hypothetical protein SAMN02799643_05537 [Methylobacterium sp. UNCCL125]